VTVTGMSSVFYFICVASFALGLGAVLGARVVSKARFSFSRGVSTCL